MSSDNPFWFLSEELLTDLLRVEIQFLSQLFTKYPDLPEFFDLPEATAQQRAACFTLLAHCALRDTIYETFAQRWQQSPSLGDEEDDVHKRTQSLFAADAPGWVQEVTKVAELLPTRIYDALPEPLRRGGFSYENPELMGTIHSAMKTLENVQEIQDFTGQVLDQQLRRLEGRWSAASRQVREPTEAEIQTKEPKKPTHWLWGTAGLGPKATDLSRYMDGLTEKQRMAFSLRFEYRLGLAEIASRMGLDRKTAYEHIQAASRKIDQIRSNAKRKAYHVKDPTDF